MTKSTRTRAETLTPKQARFVDEYLVDLNGTRAAVRAGYSVKTGNEQGARLLAKVSVATAIKAATDARSQRTEIDADFVLRGLRTVAERCLQAEPVKDHSGNPTGEWRFDSTGANRALELLGKHLRLFADKTEVTGAIQLGAVFSPLAHLAGDELVLLRSILRRRAGLGPEGSDDGHAD
jgi:phage terminase small subunit